MENKNEVIKKAAKEETGKDIPITNSDYVELGITDSSGKVGKK